MTDLPIRVVVGANGAYWRDYGDYYSMCPVSEDNDPIEVVAVYERRQPTADIRNPLVTVLARAILGENFEEGVSEGIGRRTLQRLQDVGYTVAPVLEGEPA